MKLRSKEKYQKKKASTERMKNSAVVFMTKPLNTHKEEQRKIFKP